MLEYETYLWTEHMKENIYIQVFRHCGIFNFGFSWFNLLVMVSFCWILAFCVWIHLWQGACKTFSYHWLYRSDDTFFLTHSQRSVVVTSFYPSCSSPSYRLPAIDYPVIVMFVPFTEKSLNFTENLWYFAIVKVH